jgi:hypothetical protein
MSDDELTNLVMMAEELASHEPVGYCDMPGGPDVSKIGLLMDRVGITESALERIQLQFHEQIDEALQIFSPRSASKPMVQIRNNPGGAPQGMHPKYHEPAGSNKRYVIS